MQKCIRLQAIRLPAAGFCERDVAIGHWLCRGVGVYLVND